VIDFVAESHAASWHSSSCRVVAVPAGIFNIPPIDRDEARFARRPNRWSNPADFVDIRFQDDVPTRSGRHLLLQAAAFETGPRRSACRGAGPHLALSCAVLIGAIGAVLLTYWTALAFVTRRGAIFAGLIMCSSVLLGVEARLAKPMPCCAHGGRGDGRAGAGVFVLERGEYPAHPPWSWPIIFWTALAGGILLKDR